MSRSSYYLSLTGDVKRRYDEKLNIIGDIDPYTLTAADLNLDLNLVPSITIIDMVNYLILTHSFYTGQQLKAYKSLQAFKYYEAGFVQEVLAAKITSEAYIIVGKVRHSQKTREKCLSTWIILLSDGAVSSGHCTCMAGLGEVCSHVAAILFYLENRSSVGASSCTETLSRWPIPSVKNVDMVRIRDMDWAKSDKPAWLPSVAVQPLTQEELNVMLEKFKKIDIFPAVSRVLNTFTNDELININIESLPDGLENLFMENFLQKSYDEVLKMADTVNITINNDQCKLIERATVNQYSSNMWFKYRAGRITASKFKLCARARLERPPLSLIKGICYPQLVNFFSKQTSYGALEAYLNVIQMQHQNASMRNVGFFISCVHPEFGASPDAVIMCECCGEGCVEVKCPYKLIELNLEEYASDKNSCLIKNEGSYNLNKNHSYYFQVQLQMFVTNLKYCDFFVWSKKEVFLERIGFDKDFCTTHIAKCLEFFRFVLKPELLSKHFTAKGGIGKVALWCHCKKPDDRRPMLKCDNDECNISWFHFDCVGIIDIPLVVFRMYFK